MKIIDVPQTGKLGLTVTYPSRNGLIRRSWVVPANPRSAEQLVTRSRLAAAAQAYDTLTEAQQDAWIAAAAQEQSKPTLGQSGPLTGLQLYTKLNAALAMVGEPAVVTPPEKPTFDANVAQSLELTNTAGTVAIKLVCAGSSDSFNLVRAAAPQNSGTRRPMSIRYLGELPEVVAGKSDLTALYTAKFGAPVAGQRIFVQSNQLEAGWQDLPKAFTGIVPASS
jgi:hypothetical protein